MYQLIAKDHEAKRGRLTTPHGVIETPVFMNVGTVAAHQGSCFHRWILQEIKTQVELSNTYHLHVRPGDEVVKKLGGLHKFMNWDKPILDRFGRISGVFLSRTYERSKKKACILIHILMDERFLWDRKKVCRSSPIWHPPLPWHLMNVHLIRLHREYMQNSVDRTTQMAETV